MILEAIIGRSSDFVPAGEGLMLPPVPMSHYAGIKVTEGQGGPVIGEVVSARVNDEGFIVATMELFEK